MILSSRRAPWMSRETFSGTTRMDRLFYYFFFGNTVYARVRRVCIGTTTRIVCVYTTRTGMTFAFHRVWCIRIYTKTVTGGYTNDAIYIITHTLMIRVRSEHSSTPYVFRGIIDFFFVCSSTIIRCLCSCTRRPCVPNDRPFVVIIIDHTYCRMFCHWTRPVHVNVAAVFNLGKK